MTTPALEVNNLLKFFKTSKGLVKAADGVSFTAPRGAVTALLGPNGAGKSTTINCSVGLMRPDAGEIRVLGNAKPWAASATQRAKIGVMLQDGGLYSGAKASALLKYAAQLFPNPIPPAEISARLGIGEFSNQLVRRLSGGQKQRLALALALIGRGELIFLDEPTAGMDPAIRRTTWELIKELRNSGSAVVLCTHHMDEAEALADELVIMAHGQVQISGDTASVLNRQGQRFTYSVDNLDPEKRAALEARLSKIEEELNITFTAQQNSIQSLEDLVLEVDSQS